MMFLPIIFTGFFLFFPSGLVLYWLVQQPVVHHPAVGHHQADRGRQGGLSVAAGRRTGHRAAVGR